MDRSIVHLRIDAFPVAVERLRDPSLLNKPVVVCARHSPRSLIYAASPEARSEGVWEHLPLTAALKRCRRLVVLPPDELLYRRAGERICRVLDRYSPLVEPGQWGRFFLDMTGTARLFGDAQDSAFRIRREVSEAVRLNATMGIGSNKLVSGVAARVVSACGDLYTVPSGSEASFLAPLRVRMLPAVRLRTERELLGEFNIRFVHQVAGLSPGQLAAVFGKFGVFLHRQARGIDYAPVRPPLSKPFVLQEINLDEDTNDDPVLLGLFYGMIEKACFQMRIQKVLPKTVWLHLRYSDGMDMTRRRKITHPVWIDSLMYRILEPFFLKVNERRQRVRYMSLTFTDLFPVPDQLSLFDPPEADQKPEHLISALDSIRKKFGEEAIAFGRTQNGRSGPERPRLSGPK